MNKVLNRVCAPACTLALLAAVLGSAPALAADKSSSADALARYQQERAACNNGQTNQDRATCLREASAAFAENKRGSLDDGAASYTRNAVQRCERLPAEERQACAARMQGQGSTSGSVAAGGILRELVTRETAPPVAAPDTPKQ